MDQAGHVTGGLGNLLLSGFPIAIILFLYVLFLSFKNGPKNYKKIAAIFICALIGISCGLFRLYQLNALLDESEVITVDPAESTN